MKKTPKILFVGIILGVLMTLAPIFGLLGTIFGMHLAFSKLSSTGIGNPQSLSDAIGLTMFSTITGVILFPVGILILIISLVLYFQKRRTTPPQIQSNLYS